MVLRCAEFFRSSRCGPDDLGDYISDHVTLDQRSRQGSDREDGSNEIFAEDCHFLENGFLVEKDSMGLPCKRVLFSKKKGLCMDVKSGSECDDNGTKEYNEKGWGRALCKEREGEKECVCGRSVE